MLTVFWFCLTLVARSSLNPPCTSELGHMGLARFFFHSPSERTSWQTQTCVLFRGWRKRCMKAWREGRDFFTRSWEVNMLMFDDSSPRGDSPLLSHRSPSLPPSCFLAWTSCYLFSSGDKCENHLIYFGEKTQQLPHIFSSVFVYLLLMWLHFCSAHSVDLSHKLNGMYL